MMIMLLLITMMMIYIFLIFYIISSRFFWKPPFEICSHLSEKASKGSLLKPEKLQNHSIERKGKDTKNERGEGKKEKKKKQWLHS